MIARVHSLFKREPSLRTPVDLNELVEEIVQLLRVELDGTPLQLQLAPDLPQVAADRVQLQQVLLNLITNALEAMRSVMDHSRVLTITTKTDDTGAASVAVRDSGVGLQPDQLDRLFEPFYTTKPTGLGMGLPICRSIIEGHGGRLWAECKDGAGALFRFVLPKDNGSNP